eukprot:scaffold3910_cov182-Amphora_coffeaeformis.AAC.2
MTILFDQTSWNPSVEAFNVAQSSGYHTRGNLDLNFCIPLYMKSGVLKRLVRSIFFCTILEQYLVAAPNKTLIFLAACTSWSPPFRADNHN